MNNDSFISQEIEGVKAPSSRRTKNTNTPQSTAIDTTYKTPANAPASSDGDREYVPVRFDSVPEGAVFSREIKRDTYIVHTKDKGMNDIFTPDFIVWVFRKKEAAA